MVEIKYEKVSSIYQLTEKYVYEDERIEEFPNVPDIDCKYRIKGNEVRAYKWFSWDGPSGAFNTPNLMRASLIHDILCHEANKVKDDNYKRLRKIADEIYFEISKEDGVSWFRAHYQLIAIRTFGILKGLFK